MQLVAVDIGNSSTKLAVAGNDDDSHWLHHTTFENRDRFQLPFELGREPAFWSVSSVNRGQLSLLSDWVASHRSDDIFHPISAAEVDLVTEVESRERLGRDRLIASWTAVQLNQQGCPLVVVDAGTAVTVDYVNGFKVFAGGLIFPGAELCFQQLATNTDGLPNLADWRPDDESLSVIGKSTDQAIYNGVKLTQLATIKSAVALMTKLSGQPTVVYLTGGGIAPLVSSLPGSWIHCPDLVLQGAKAIGFKICSELTQSQE